jgi:hypothetical protein
VRDVLYRTVSIDHNVVDGAPATRFAADLRMALHRCRAGTEARRVAVERTPFVLLTLTASVRAPGIRKKRGESSRPAASSSARPIALAWSTPNSPFVDLARSDLAAHVRVLRRQCTS